MRQVLSVLFVVVFAGCVQHKQIAVADRVPAESKVGILEFRDCPNAKGPQCDGSGVAATVAFSRGFEEKSHISLVRIVRPVAPNALITDKQALLTAAAEGVDFVLVGDVHAYLDMQPSNTGNEAFGGGNRDQAGVMVRLIRIRDSRVLATLNDDQTGFAVSSPDVMFENMGEDFAKMVRK